MASITSATGRTELNAAELDLITSTAAVIARPTVEPPDSFALHAALELGARHDLLGRISPAARPTALGRIEELRSTYAAWDAIEAPDGISPGSFVDPDDAARSLVDSIADADADAADRAAHWLALHVEPAAIAPLVVDALLPMLTAAGHGVIALDRLARCHRDDPVGATGLRMLAREAARNPDWQITWHRGAPAGQPGGPGGADALAAALAEPPSPGPLQSTFIYPTVDLVQRTGAVATALGAPLAGVDRDLAAATILRSAAASMIQDDPDHAPYGWSHCLTLPLGALGVAHLARRPADAVAVAATYAYAFRATLGRVRVDPAAADRAGTDLPDVTELCDHAATHPDAHLVKYTLACMNAAERDPAARTLYVAAAATLGDWWRTHDDA